MKEKNIELVNQIINEAGQYIIGTINQYTAEWEYACFVSCKTKKYPYGEFHVFHQNKLINFKSTELVFILYTLFEDYKRALNISSKDTSIKYTIRNSDLRDDIQLETNDKAKWSSESEPSAQSTFEFLIGDAFS